MKRNILIAGSALTLVLAVTSSDAFSQRYPQNYPPPPRPRPVYQQPAAPFIIVDADGRRSGYQGRSFDNCDEQRSLSRKQRRRLEKRFGVVPPLVMYVPDRFVNRTRRGDIYVYNNGLVYQRQRDGFFHLDDRYFSGDRFDDRDDRGNNGTWARY